MLQWNQTDCQSQLEPVLQDQHNSTKFIDLLENISDFLNDDLIHAIVSAYADKGYDAAYISNYLRCYGINCCIPYKKNSKTVSQNLNQKYYGKTRFVVERFFAWLKCGFNIIGIRHNRNSNSRIIIQNSRINVA